MQVKSIEILIKPASSSCNLRCAYCFYLDECNNRAVSNYGFMSKETAHAIIDKAFSFASEEVSFTFQGGEPLLAGLDFFRDFVFYARKNSNGKGINFSIQTNGTLIDKSYAEFFTKENFLVGVSIDGPKEVHDKLRGLGSFEKMMAGVGNLRAAGLNPNALCVLTDKNTGKKDSGRWLYKYLRSQGFNVLQFIPCIDEIKIGEGEKLGDKAPKQSDSGDGFEAPRLSADNFGKFLRGSFESFVEELGRGEEVSVRYFENLALVLSGDNPESCTLCGRCKLTLTIEADGSVFPCDFYAMDEYLLGNINKNSIEELASSKIAQAFIKEEDPCEECKLCKFYKLCRGGCKRERILGKTKYCESYKSLFTYLADRTKG